MPKDKLSIEEVIELVNMLDGYGLISTNDQLLIEELERQGFAWTDESSRQDYFDEDDEC